MASESEGGEQVKIPVLEPVFCCEHCVCVQLCPRQEQGSRVPPEALGHLSASGHVSVSRSHAVRVGCPSPALPKPPGTRCISGTSSSVSFAYARRFRRHCGQGIAGRQRDRVSRASFADPADKCCDNKQTSSTFSGMLEVPVL